MFDQKPPIRMFSSVALSAVISKPQRNRKFCVPAGGVLPGTEPNAEVPFQMAFERAVWVAQYPCVRVVPETTELSNVHSTIVPGWVIVIPCVTATLFTIWVAPR